MHIRSLLLAAGLAAVTTPALAGDEPLVTYKSLSPSAALKVAEHALAACQEAGYQVAISVVDRAGVPLVMLRDRYAGPHTPDTAFRKAWTAISFRTDTTEMAAASVAGEPQSGVRFVSQALMLGGGIQITAAGSLVGGIGVSGAPGGNADDDCARAGIDAIQDDLAFF